MNYNYIDLFHGIGGFALGAHWAGMKFENHFCSDIEPYAQKLYKLRFPDSVQLGDITKIDTEELKKYGDKWIITGGFPCQDISIAGKGEGITGARSGLWFEYWRIIRDLRPRFAIMENVGALVNWFDCERRPTPDSDFCEGDKWSVDIRQIQAITTVISNLTEIGYNAEWQDIRAEDVGAPHKRERIWIVSYPELHGRSSGKVRGSTEKTIRKEPSGADGAQHIERTDILSETGTDVANAGCESERRKEKFKRSYCEPDRCSTMQYGKKYKGTGQREIPNTLSQHDDNSGYGASEVCRERSEEAKISGCVAYSDNQRFDRKPISIREKQKENIETNGQSEGAGEIPDTSSKRQSRQGSYAKPIYPKEVENGEAGRVNNFCENREKQWELEPSVGRLAHGIPCRVDRLKGLGNAIVPQIAEILFRQIKNLL